LGFNVANTRQKVDLAATQSVNALRGKTILLGRAPQRQRLMQIDGPRQKREWRSGFPYRSWPTMTSRATAMALLDS
jgi:hypothetical protein